MERKTFLTRLYGLTEQADAQSAISAENMILFCFIGNPINIFFDPEAVGKPRGPLKRNNMKRQKDKDGRIFWSIRSGGKEYRYYEDSIIIPSDVWDDISHLQQKDPERTGYDTQKPESLLERMVLSTTRQGDWVGDFFAGSGTTLAVAQKNGRKWLAVDKSVFSMYVSRKGFYN